MNVNKPCLSVIIPVYNTEKYLPRCVDSVLGQSFQDFELLLVDDGSTDGSGFICDAYSEKDSRVSVFHKENGGVSSARNVGLKEAKGDWISFVDSDDELLPDGLQVMVGGISEKVSMVQAGFCEYENGRLITDTGTLKIKSSVVDRQQALMMLYQYEGVYMGYPVGRLFERKMIIENHITFDEHIVVKEDTLFVASYLCQSEKPVYFTSTPVYLYYKTTSGVMGGMTLTYNPSYSTSFEAVVSMNRLIQKLPGVDEELSSMAKWEVITRCYRIYEKMLQHDAVDKKVMRRLKKRARKEVGLGYYSRFQYHRNKRRVKGFLERKLRVK